MLSAVGIQLTTNDTIKQYAAANGAWRSAATHGARLDYALAGVAGLVLAGLALLR
jgi:hypothetical protein